MCDLLTPETMAAKVRSMKKRKYDSEKSVEREEKQIEKEQKEVKSRS